MVRLFLRYVAQYFKTEQLSDRLLSQVNNFLTYSKTKTDSQEIWLMQIIDLDGENVFVRRIINDESSVRAETLASKRHIGNTLLLRTNFKTNNEKIPSLPLRKGEM